MQAVILAGGMGTRLRPLTANVPKILVRIHGKPFIFYQLHLLQLSSVKDVILCVKYRSGMIKEVVGDGREIGFRIRYSCDGPRYLGTAGALRKASSLLEDVFVVMNGDSYVPIEFDSILTQFSQVGVEAMVAVYKNREKYDKSNVCISGEYVSVYNRTEKLKGMDYIDAGVTVLKRSALRRIPRNGFADLTVLYQSLIKDGQLAAYKCRHRFHEIGSFEGLKAFGRYIARQEARQTR